MWCNASCTTTRMNQLEVNQQETIISLWKRGWSARRIAREMGFDRETTSKYIRQEKAKPATPTAGIIPVAPAVPNATDDLATDTFAQAMAAARANVSLCERWKPVIVAGLDQGLSATRIHQDLVRDHGFAGGYESVKRFVRKLEQTAPVPFRRMDFAPGEQMQVDFGAGAWIVEPDGRRRRPQIFRAVLSCSRAGYSEATFDQKTETFLRCLENAYRHFGGVPVTTAPDNLKAAVLHADWYDPELNPKLAAFAAHYGTVIRVLRGLGPDARPQLGAAAFGAARAVAKRRRERRAELRRLPPSPAHQTHQPLHSKNERPSLSFAGPWRGRKHDECSKLKKWSRLRREPQAMGRLVLKKYTCFFNIIP